MIDYGKSKIYKIEPTNSIDSQDVYYGSTTKDTLAMRMCAHRSDYKKWKMNLRCYVSSYSLFEKYGLENCKIYLVEHFPCQSKDELHAREGYFIQNNPCVNKRVEGRSMKQYHIQHKEAIQEYQKQYRELNKNVIKEYSKQYRELNKKAIRINQKEYREFNKMAIQEKQKIQREKNKEKNNLYSKLYREKLRLQQSIEVF